MPLPAKLTEVTHEHLQQLVTDGASEGPHLDFKRELPTNWDSSAKANFIHDVIAFANAGGGDLVYGVDEDVDARAREVVPQRFDSVDMEVRRLQDFMLNSVEPRIQGAQVQAVSVGDGHVVVVRVPQSWAGPHRSKVNFHFYVRDGLRNRQLDVPEIRALFLRSDSQAQRMRDFRSDRLAKILTGQTPVPMGSGPKLIVHAISTQAAQGALSLDPLVYFGQGRDIPRLGDTLASIKLNLDGASSGTTEEGYTQHFRQGYFEGLVSLVPRLPNEAAEILAGTAYERDVIRFLGSVRGEFERYGVSTEIVVFLSLTSAHSVKMAGPSEYGPGWGHSLKQFDRRDVLLPDVLIESGISIGRGVRPAFDLMSQAAGYLGSPNYGDDGEWRQAR